MPESMKSILDRYNLRRRPRPGEVLAHNPVARGRTTRNNVNGFRAFYVPKSAHWTVCSCGWRPDKGVHYKARNNKTRTP